MLTRTVIHRVIAFRKQVLVSSFKNKKVTRITFAKRRGKGSPKKKI